MENDTLKLGDIAAVFGSMPIGQLIFFGLFAATWLIGGNILVALHYKRVGKHWASGFKPFAFPFRNFNAKEWLMLAMLALMSLLFGIIAISYGK